MDRQKGSKLNRILQACPSGSVAPTAWLTKQGVSRQLLARYEEYHWVTRAAKGAVFRSGDTVTWQGIIYALQNLLNLDLWIGGRGALQLKGLDHFLALSNPPKIRLFSSTITKLPKWVSAFEKVAHFTLRRTSLFAKPVSSLGFSETMVGNLKIRVSSPERAILELLETVPSIQTFEEAELIFENLTTLRPKEIQKLLEACSSVKVKRLFLYFAEKSGHSWFTKIDTSKIDLGRGKRAIVPRGELNLKYQILVPRRT